MKWKAVASAVLLGSSAAVLAQVAGAPIEQKSDAGTGANDATATAPSSAPLDPQGNTLGSTVANGSAGDTSVSNRADASARTRRR